MSLDAGAEQTHIAEGGQEASSQPLDTQTSQPAETERPELKVAEPSPKETAQGIVLDEDLRALEPKDVNKLLREGLQSVKQKMTQGRTQAQEALRKQAEADAQTGRNQVFRAAKEAGIEAARALGPHATDEERSDAFFAATQGVIIDATLTASEQRFKQMLSVATAERDKHERERQEFFLSPEIQDLQPWFGEIRNMVDNEGWNGHAAVKHIRRIVGVMKSRGQIADEEEMAPLRGEDIIPGFDPVTSLELHRRMKRTNMESARSGYGAQPSKKQQEQESRATQALLDDLYGPAPNRGSYR